MLFEAAARRKHAPSVYYLGIMAANGHGIDVNYELALRYFESARGLQHPQASGAAARAARELQQSLTEARAHNNAVFDVYKQQLEEP
jgi:TPR repeat protein